MDKPAIYGGKPAAQSLIPVISPTLIEPRKLIPGIEKIFWSGSVTSSGYVRALEEACARYCGVRYAVAVSSATSALMIAVKGMGLSGEVIVPSFTFAATVHALSWNGITPVFADCEPGTYNIDINDAEKKISSRTSAIMAVSIFGSPPRIQELELCAKARKLALIFDSAQGFSAQYRGKILGGFGRCEVFSLSPTKVITSLEGGIITTNDRALADFCVSARDYGKTKDAEDIGFAGLSARMSEVHALIAIRNMEKLHECLAVRRRMIDIYKKLLDGIEGIGFQEILPEASSSCNYMVIFVNENKFMFSRDELYKALEAENIQTKKYFYPAVHLQKAYSAFAEKYRGKLPVTEQASREGLALPLYGHMNEKSVRIVCSAIRKIYEWRRAHAKYIGKEKRRS